MDEFHWDLNQAGQLTSHMEQRTMGRSCFLLLSLLCAWLLQGGQPLLAHEEQDLEGEGHFSQPAFHVESSFHVQRMGPTVSAVLTSTRSPVQFFARQKPTVLLTMPTGLRPTDTVVFAAEGLHLLKDGSAHPSRPGPLTFHIRVTPDGEVGYVDNSAVDGIGYMQYRTAWTWPGAGANPHFCRRSSELQAHVLTDLRGLGDSQLTCGAVTWDLLAQIRTLGTQASVAEDTARVHLVRLHDLAGMNGLETARLSISDHIPLSDLLVHTPRLTSLSLNGYDLEMPSDFLASAPQLTSLGLQGRHLQLPQDFLHDAPQLLSLSLSGNNLELPADFLKHAPHLTSLILSGSELVLPSELLRHTPHLTSLSLHGTTLRLSPGFLDHTPDLTALSLSGSGFELSTDLLKYVPHLTSLSLTGGRLQLTTEFLSHSLLLIDLSLSGPGLELPADLLRHVSQLKSLSLNSQSLDLPAEFLDHTPHLTALSLRGGELDLQFGLLDSIPQLTSLSLEGSILRLPVGLLQPVDQLTTLSLSGNELRLPTGLLAPVTHLTTLVLEGLPTEIPADLLQYAPNLSILSLSGNSPGNLSERDLTVPLDLLSHTPRLTTLTLRNFGALTMPLDLLAATPDLTSLTLVARRNFTFKQRHSYALGFGRNLMPRDFLKYTPRLKTLELRAETLELGTGLLHNSPRLANLILDSWGRAWSNEFDTQFQLPYNLTKKPSPLNQLTLRRGTFWLYSDPHNPNLRTFYLQGVPIWQ